MSATPFEPSRFNSTVAHYLAHRPRYPNALLVRVLKELGLGTGARVLDLGCGPGFLANGFAGLGCQVVGLDPSAPMLDAARAEAARCGAQVDYRLGSSYDLDAMQERFDLVAIGRAFHWMDRAQTLAALDRLVLCNGAVALFYDSHLRCSENAAITVADRVRETYGRVGHAGPPRKSRLLVPDESVFLDSVFSQLLRIGLIERRALDAETLVGRSLSTSFTSPAVLGTRTATFEADLSAKLAELRSDGRHTELIEFTALLCRRVATERQVGSSVSA